MIKKIYGLCFSPAGKTEKIVKRITSAMSELLCIPCEFVSITTPSEREIIPEFKEEDFIIIGTPTYAGRVPNKIMPYITENIKGENGFAAAIVTYGNRNFDDSLIELSSIIDKNGFNVIGGGTFVAEHSFAKSLATGRPDETDFVIADKLAKGLSDKINSANYKKPCLPGNPQYDSYYIPKGIDGKPAKFLKAKPVKDTEKCTLCGKCAQVCPMGSISKDEKFNVTGICIKCQACIKVCPEEARYFDDEAFLSHKEMLEKNFAETHKESEIYL